MVFCQLHLAHVIRRMIPLSLLLQGSKAFLTPKVRLDTTRTPADHLERMPTTWMPRFFLAMRKTETRRDVEIGVAAAVPGPVSCKLLWRNWQALGMLKTAALCRVSHVSRTRLPEALK